MTTAECRYSGRCSGCTWIDRSVEEQRSKKLVELAPLFEIEQVQWVDCGVMGLRDRVDLTWDEGRLGLYDRSESREIVDLEVCPMLSKELSAWHQLYRSQKPPIRRGSVRLRVSPAGERGVWLDFANADVKSLFDEKEYLRWLSNLAIVEIGQRKKRLEWVNDAPKLRDPKLHAWFQTYASNGETLPVFGAVASFTQPGFSANRALVSEVLAHVQATGEADWLELFAGSGNFALALAKSGYRVRAVEMDAVAVEAMNLSCEMAGIQIEMLRHDLYRSFPESFGSGGWLLDPPRSGLKNLIEKIAEVKPKQIVYVSCWSEALRSDSERLQSLGYKLMKLSGVDQFIHSPHVEWVATFISV